MSALYTCTLSPLLELNVDRARGPDCCQGQIIIRICQSESEASFHICETKTENVVGAGGGGGSHTVRF